ncbi:O-antigen polymerase [Blastococcus deserti]|uniref:O-antigen polymerase n=1 Tax=Blastococcus deserti TaxID=2259033 RepID=A0ABW4XDR5_9ACTN
MSDLYALILGTVLVAGTATTWLAHRRLALAVVAHNAAWACGLLIVGSGLMNYVALSLTAWTVITGSIVAFNFGAWVVVARKRRHDPGAAAAGEGAGASIAFIGLPAYWALFVLFNIGFALYLWTIAQLFGLSTLISDPISIRGNSQIPYMEAFPVYGKALFYLAPLCFVLTLFPGLVRGLASVPTLLRYGVMAWLIVAQAATLQRSNIFQTLVWALGIYLLALAAGGAMDLGVRFRVRHVLGVLLVGLVVFQGIAMMLGKTGTTNPAVRYSVSPEMRDSSLTGVLHYAGGGIPAFGMLVESRNDAWPHEGHSATYYGDYNPQTWGAATLSAPFDVIPGAPQWDEIAAHIRVPAPTNVFTWLEPWYRDFRIVGAFAGSLLVGLVCGSFTRRAVLSPGGLLTGGLIIGLTGMAVFANRMTSTMTLVLLVALGVLHLYARWRAGSGPEAETRSVTASGSPRRAA